MYTRFFSIMVLSALLTACATGHGPPRPAGPPPASASQAADPVHAGSGASGEIATVDAQQPDPRDVEVHQGTGSFINEKAARQRPRPAMADDGEVTFNWEGASLQDVVHIVLGDLLQENFVIGPGVSGEVTFSTAKPISKKQVLPILEMLLRWNGATLVYTDGRYHVLPISNALRGHLTPRMGSADSVRGYEVRAVPLKYISPTEMQKLLEPYAREDAILNADNARGLLFLAGTREELGNYLHTVEIFDVDWLEGMSIGLFPLSRVEVATVVPELEAVFGEQSESPLAGMFRFMPLERLNSVMVITPQPRYLERAREWVERLDRGSTAAASRLYVYQVENLEAAVLADYLSQIFGSGVSGRRDRNGQVAPGLQPVTLDTFNERSVEDATRRRNRPERRANDANDGIGLVDSEDVSITAVEETNSLLIQASAQQYEAILAAIKRLDQEPLQVHVETQIIEVLLNEQLQFGVNWFFSNQQPGDTGFPDGFFGPSGSAPLSTGRDSDRGAITNNFFTTLTRRGVGRTFVSATISALDSVSDTRILSAPSLMIRNNEEASINVGESLAVTSTTFNPSVGQNNTIASNQYIRTGVQLSVTPRVNPGGLVYLDIQQQVSSPSSSTSANNNPNINERALNTKIAVQSGETVLLGGLIRETDLDSEGGLPGVRRIPWFGRLFGNKTRNQTRTELLVLITPTVVQSDADLRNVTEEYQRKFETVKPIRQGEKITLSTSR